MSTYLSYRRRYSEPEKPEPRFQWRLRVHSLMMDESDNTETSSNRRIQRRDFSEAYRFNDETRQNERRGEVNSRVETMETHRTRRERFTRTKSEGHLKLRVRFSKFSDSSKSFDNDDDGDDDEPEMYVRPENRKYRPSQESGISSVGDHCTDEDGDGFARCQDTSVPQFNDNVNVVDGFACEMSSEVSFDNESADQCENLNVKEKCENDHHKDISKGAIPKRYTNTNVAKLDLLNRGKCDGDQESPTVMNSSDSVTAVKNINEDRENSLSLSEKTEQSENSTTNTEREVHADTVSSGAIQAVSIPCEDNENDFGIKESSEKLGDDRSNGNENQATEGANNNFDDIESIIERIIAEEEATMGEGKNNPTEINSRVENVNNQDINTTMNKIKQLKGNTQDDDGDKCGFSIAGSISQERQRSSSLPSYRCDEDGDLTHPVVPFSSSCPSSKKEISKSNETKEEKEELEDVGWAYLPVILLEDVFTLLSPKERHQASQVCRQWFDLFYSPRVWETFILLERTLTKKRFNLYKGYQRELCPGKTQLCFRRVGSFFKRIVVTPITDYFNLYEFLRILAAFLQYQEDHGLAAMPLLHTFDFTFACASRGDGGVIVHGTGGQILEMLKQLLIRISKLKHLKLNQLLIDDMDVPGLFDAMANCFSECLNSLEMLNVTKVPFGLTDLARFRNLVKLTVSPQHLNEEVLLLLAGLNLSQLCLLQDPYTCECESVSYEAWKLVREIAPWLRVFLEVCGNTRAQLLIQPRAPVYGVFLRTPYSRLTNDLVMSLVEHYSKTLRYFVQERLPRVHGPRGIDVRCDSSLLFLVRRCQAIHTLVVRERISTSTLILVANEGKNLLTLLVRRHGLIKRCDWPQPGAWTKEFYDRLKYHSLDYDRSTDEVCTLLRQRWRPLTDKQFMRLKIIPRVEELKWR